MSVDGTSLYANKKGTHSMPKTRILLCISCRTPLYKIRIHRAASKTHGMVRIPFILCVDA